MDVEGPYLRLGQITNAANFFSFSNIPFHPYQYLIALVTPSRAVDEQDAWHRPIVSWLEGMP